MQIEHVFASVSDDPAAMTDDELTLGLQACARGRAHLDGCEARILAEVTKRQLATKAGLADPAKVLRQATGVSGRESRKRAKLSRQLERLPRVADGLRGGDLTLEHASLLADAHADHARCVEAAEPELLAMATRSNPDDFRTQLQQWQRSQSGDDGETELAGQRRRRRGSIYDNDDGMAVVFAELDPIWGAEVHSAIQHHADRLWRREAKTGQATHIPRSRRRQLFADALLEMARLSMNPAGAADDDGAGPLAPPHASLVAVIGINWLMGRLDEAGFSELADGTPVPVSELRKLAAQVGIIPMVLDTDGTVLDMGRRSRCATDEQRLALLVRDGVCAFPDCDQSGAGFTHAHHIVEWAQGGRTDLDGLVNVCAADHHQIHDRGWAVGRADDGTWWTHRPDGTPHKPLRRRSPPPADTG
ncbi:MAG: DUF222 domain-containing protein [Acidimicrobiales bacterium]